MSTVAVIISTFGDRQIWDPLTHRAIASLSSQTRLPDSVHRIHHNSLHEARNHGAEVADADWLCFLDADDELEPGYIEHMMRPGRPFELRYPSVRFVKENEPPPEPVVLRAKPLFQGNFMVIGTLVPRSIFMEAGGFRCLPAYEDWDLWIRCSILGCHPRLVKSAIYRANHREYSRNQLAIHDAPKLCSEIIKYSLAWKRRIDREALRVNHNRW